MSNLLANWWRSRQFHTALKKGNTHLAQQLLEETQRAGARLSLLERVFRDKLQADQSSAQYEREVLVLREQINQASQTIEELSRAKQQVDNLLLPPHQKFIESVEERFRLNAIGENLLQCTGIDEEVFYELEKNLIKYLESEFRCYTPQENLNRDLVATYAKDITALKKGQDPQYDSYLSPHVYFMIYFLEGVYSGYIAWFLVYKYGLLQTKLNILDIGAGSGAMLYGLFLFLISAGEFVPLYQSHLSYCSLEQQGLLQHHGLEFWKQYIEPQTTALVNTYYRFNTIDLFSYGINSNEGRELPKKFFDFIVISHCIFAAPDQRAKSHQVYKRIFTDSLKDKGYVLVVVQGKRLFQAYGRSQSENQAQEERLIRDFLEEVGLRLEWYQYVSSTGQRTPSTDAEFIKRVKTLPPLKHMSKLRKQYLAQKYVAHYTLDDYVILARR